MISRISAISGKVLLLLLVLLLVLGFGLGLPITNGVRNVQAKPGHPDPPQENFLEGFLRGLDSA